MDTSVLGERQVSQLLVCPEETELTPMLQRYARQDRPIDITDGITQHGLPPSANEYIQGRLSTSI